MHISIEVSIYLLVLWFGAFLPIAKKPFMAKLKFDLLPGETPIGTWNINYFFRSYAFQVFFYLLVFAIKRTDSSNNKLSTQVRVNRHHPQRLADNSEVNYDLFALQLHSGTPASGHWECAGKPSCSLVA